MTLTDSSNYYKTNRNKSQKSSNYLEIIKVISNFAFGKQRFSIGFIIIN